MKMKIRVGFIETAYVTAMLLLHSTDLCSTQLSFQVTSTGPKHTNMPGRCIIHTVTYVHYLCLQICLEITCLSQDHSIIGLHIGIVCVTC